MNYVQFKDPVSYVCLFGAVVASWSLTHEIAGSNPFDDSYFLSLKKKHLVKTKLQTLCLKKPPLIHTDLVADLRFANLQGVQIYNLAKYPQKLHEIKRMWTPRGGVQNFTR